MIGVLAGQKSEVNMGFVLMTNSRIQGITVGSREMHVAMYKAMEAHAASIPSSPTVSPCPGSGKPWRTSRPVGTSARSRWKSEPGLYRPTHCGQRRSRIRSASAVSEPQPPEMVTPPSTLMV